MVSELPLGVMDHEHSNLTQMQVSKDATKRPCTELLNFRVSHMPVDKLVAN